MQNLYQCYKAHPHICTDSRQVAEDDIFFALVGPTFDGNDYALQALARGAAYAVVSRPELAEAEPERCLLVPDTLRALQELAKYHREQLSIPIIAITGTNGKTTTKELTHALLSTTYRVQATKGNLNNHIGVPLTLLSITPQHQVAIVEMGASSEGEIAFLCHLAQPTLGLITNVGRAHLEGFGSQEGVLRAKGELAHYLTEYGGQYLLNADDPLLLREWAGRATYTYTASEAQVLTDVPALTLSVPLQGKNYTIHTQLVGRYNLHNVLAALKVGELLSVPPQSMVAAIEAYLPSNSRSQLVELGRGCYLVLDAYNANPSSMLVALEGLLHWQAPHKLAILGEMRELGNASHTEHARIVEWLKAHPSITPLFVGAAFQEVTDALPNVVALNSFLTHYPIEAGTAILLKGSRGTTLEQALPTLRTITQ